MYKLFSDILITKGAARDLFVDVGRNKVKLISKDITKIIESFDDLNVCYNDDELIIINELIESEFIFEISEKASDLFPKIELEWENPSKITNCIILVSKTNLSLIETALSQLEKLQCYYFTIVFIDDFSSEQYISILNALNYFSIISFELVFNYYENDFFENHIINTLQIDRMIVKPIIFNCLNIDLIENYSQYIVFKDGMYSNLVCGCIKKENFNSNIYLYSESQNFNTCLNRKLSIDEFGNIKNCPSLKKDYGNIQDTSLVEVINNNDFKKLWDIKKDEILTCKDCEFRHICTDCRAFTENPEDVYSKPLKCGYNPYTNIWEEWSINPIKQNGIEFYGMQHLVIKK